MEENKVKEPLTGSQREYLDFIKAFIKDNGYSPAPEDIAFKFKTGMNNVRRYVDILCEKGWLRKDSSKRPPVLEVL